ncbi:MAG: hypothetical protein V4727_08700 [Verrucomicrobiota bacterium]
MKRLFFIFLLGMHATLALPEAEPAAVEEAVAVEAVPEVDPQYQEIEPALVDKYFSKKPSQFLIDPQAFISGEQRKGIETLLTNHAADSTIDLYLFIFGGDQKLPIEGINKDFVTRHFSQGKPVVTLYYYFGDPNRTEMHLSPSIANAVSSSEQQRSVQSSLMRAMRANGSFEQLEEFLMQFSVRTYWMERMMDEASGKAPVEVSVEEAPVVQVEEKKMNPLEMIPEKFKGPALIAAAGLGSVVILWVLILWVRSRSRYKFPELEVEARLGGSHAAGIGAVVNFASPAVSPAHQREQVPEYLRRA